MDNNSAPPADGLEPQPPGSVHTSIYNGPVDIGASERQTTPTVTRANQADIVSGTVPTLHGVFLASPAPQDTQVVGPVVVFHDPVFFDSMAFQLRSRHGHDIRLKLQELYLATGQMVVVLSSSTGQLNWRDLAAGKYVLTIDGRQVFDCFGRGPLGGIAKVRFFPLLSNPSALGPLADALGLPSPT
jgi:hypothetical protein